jgi:ATP-dependent Clp protease ATP-binding subunit ClpX
VPSKSHSSACGLPSLEDVEEVVISQQVVEGTAGPLYMYAARAGGARAT